MGTFVKNLPLDVSKANTDYEAFLNLLKPILITRVSDTPGNKVVREVT